MNTSFPHAGSANALRVGPRHSSILREARFRPSLLALACFSALQGASVEAAEFSGLGLLPGDSYSAAIAVSADGSVVVGTSMGMGLHAFRWTASGGMANIGGAYSFSVATGVSADGSVVVGEYDTDEDGRMEAFRWTSGGLTTLGSPSGIYDISQAWGVSGNGKVVVGAVRDSRSGQGQAIAWRADNSSVLLGYLAGHDGSIAKAASYDGSVIVGASWSSLDSGREAFRYTQAGGMVGLGHLGGDYSYANAVSSDGLVVVGDATNAGGEKEAFRWTSGSGMVGLGKLSGWDFSSAQGVSSNGGVVVGYGGVLRGTSVAFRWTQATGLRTISSLLAESGVNVGKWHLDIANGVSADGNTVVGQGTNPSGLTEAYIARLAGTSTTDAPPALIGVVDFSNSVASLQALSHLSSEVARSGINAETPGLSGLMGLSAAPVFQYVSGSRGEMGGAALTWRQPGYAVAGQVGHVEARSSGLHNGGRSDYRGQWAGAAASLDLGKLLGQPVIDGLELEAAARTGRYDADINRNYLNGASVETSRGSTHGRDTTLLARLGWRFPVTESVRLTPYVQWMDNRTRFNGYSETGGAMAGAVSAQKQNTVETSAGLSAAWQISPEFELRGRYSLNRLHDAERAPVSVTVAGLGTFAAGGSRYDRNWQEFGVGVDWAATNRIRVNASVATTSGSDYPENWSAGVAVNFGL